MKREEKFANLIQELHKKLQGRAVVLVTSLILILIMLYPSLSKIRESNFERGENAGRRMLSTAEDVSRLWYGCYLTTERYISYKDAFNILSRKAWRGEEISNEDIERYNRALKAIGQFDYDHEKLESNTTYILGLRNSFRQKVYLKIFYDNLDDIPEEKRGVFDVLYDRATSIHGYKEKEYNEFFKYAEELLGKYMTGVLNRTIQSII